MLRSIRRHRDAIAIGVMAAAILGTDLGLEAANAAPVPSSVRTHLLFHGEGCYEDGVCFDENVFRITGSAPIMYGTSLKKARAQIIQRDYIARFVGSDAKPKYSVVAFPQATIDHTPVAQAINVMGRFYGVQSSNKYVPNNRWNLLVGNENAHSILISIRTGFACTRGALCSKG